MNTFEKGKKFEDEVFEALTHELKEDRLGISPASAKMFLKKGYFSRDRGTDIIIDISIEIWPEFSKNYSFLWVCECKNYGHPVPVDDIEEFKAKLDQIASKNVKGVFATSNSLQTGALSYAQSQGIGIVRILPTQQIDWVFHMILNSSMNTGSKEIYTRALTDESYVAQNQAFFGINQNNYASGWQSFLRTTLA